MSKVLPLRQCIIEWDSHGFSQFLRKYAKKSECLLSERRFSIVKNIQRSNFHRIWIWPKFLVYGIFHVSVVRAVSSVSFLLIAKTVNTFEIQKLSKFNLKMLTNSPTKNEGRKLMFCGENARLNLGVKSYFGWRFFVFWKFY